MWARKGRLECAGRHLLTVRVCSPSNTCLQTHFPCVSFCQSLTVRSAPLEARMVPSGEKATPQTGAVWPCTGEPIKKGGEIVEYHNVGRGGGCTCESGNLRDGHGLPLWRTSDDPFAIEDFSGPMSLGRQKTVQRPPFEPKESGPQRRRSLQTKAHPKKTLLLAVSLFTYSARGLSCTGLQAAAWILA